jgi:hypothetical protein
MSYAAAVGGFGRTLDPRIRMPTTVMIRGSSARDLEVTKVVEALGKVMEAEDIQCVQYLGNTTCRVTLVNDEAKERLLNHGLIVENVVMSLHDVEKTNVEVRVLYAPYNAPLDRIQSLLSEYGRCTAVRREVFREAPSIATGTLIARMLEINKNIPRRLRIGGHSIQVSYRGQVPQCFKCGELGHRAVMCTNGFKCFQCGEFGHVRANCGRCAECDERHPRDVPCNHKEDDEETSSSDQNEQHEDDTIEDGNQEEEETIEIENSTPLMTPSLFTESQTPPNTDARIIQAVDLAMENLNNASESDFSASETSNSSPALTPSQTKDPGKRPATGDSSDAKTDKTSKRSKKGNNNKTNSERERPKRGCNIQTSQDISEELK